MKRMGISVALLAFIVVVCSCSDIFREDEQLIQGNISVINPHNEEDKGYKLVLHEKAFNSNVIEDYVTEIHGNDSVMAVNAVSKKSCEKLFFKIVHDRGKAVDRVEAVSYETYNALITRYALKELFKTGDYVCE